LLILTVHGRPITI